MIELHAEAPKIIVPLFARTLPELTAQAAAAQRADAADLVELRLDPSCGTPPTGRVFRRCSASTTLVPRPAQAS